MVARKEDIGYERKINLALNDSLLPDLMFI